MATKKTGQARSKRSPQRMCVACRQSFDKRQLTRIVQSADAGVIVDLTGKKNGRGAYLCWQPQCWEQAIRRNALNQALKATLSEEEKADILKYRPISPPQSNDGESEG